MDEEGLPGIGITDVLYWLWGLLPFEIKSTIVMYVLTIVAVVLVMACCCTICFCSPCCCCAVWLEKRRRDRNRERKQLQLVDEKQILREPSAPPLV